MTRKTPENLHRKWDAKWAEPLYCEVGVYVYRWRVETPWFSLRLHHWLHSDDDRNQHDHPWAFVTFILKGSYTDIGAEVEQRCTPGHFYYRPALHKHWVRLDAKDCWTFVVTGPRVHSWGFWVQSRFVRSYEYFRKWGSHVCD